MTPDLDIYPLIQRLFAVVVVIVATVLLIGCGEEWDGHVYPDKADLTQSEYVGRYPSLQECRAAALAKISLLRNPHGADYECGLNCKSSGYGVLICEKTLR